MAMEKFKLVVFSGQMNDIVCASNFDAVDYLSALNLQADQWHENFAFGPWCDRLSSRLYALTGSPRRWVLKASIG